MHHLTVLIFSVVTTMLVSISYTYATPEIVIAHGSSVPVIEKNTDGRSRINIVPANEQGLSHNQYQEFHVDENGVVLDNNSSHASIILNEVVGNNISHLNGNIEVTGKTADVIVANPNGISCNGCGFINSMRSMLTTGKLIFEGGNITGMEVSSGNITIGEHGAVIYTNKEINHGSISLIAAGVDINGKIRGQFYSDNKTSHKNFSPEQTSTEIQRIHVVAGRRRVNKKPIDNKNILTEMEYNANEYKENEKIDVGMLGGMYARQIYLHGSKSGIGVNSESIIHGAEDITFNTNGTLVLNTPITADNVNIKNASVFNNNNELIAKKNISISGLGKILNGSESDLLSQKKINSAKIISSNIDIDAQSLYNYSNILAKNNLHIKTFNDQNNRMNPGDSQENNFKNYASILSNGNIAIESTSFNNDIHDKSEVTPIIHANNELKINTLHGLNSGGVLSANKKVSIHSMDNKSSSEYLHDAKKENSINKSEFKNSGGMIFSADEIDIQLHSFENKSSINNIASEYKYPRSGDIYANNKINTKIDNFINDEGRIFSKNTIFSSKNFTNISGFFYSIDNKISSENFIHKTKITKSIPGNDFKEMIYQKGFIQSENNTTITASDKLIIEGSDIYSGGDININGGTSTKITSDFIKEKKTTKTYEDKIEDSFYKIYSLKNEKKTQSLIQQPVIPIINSKKNIFLKSDGNIELSGVKIYADEDVSIENSHGDIKLKPFYIMNATYEEDNLSRDVKILFGIKTWEENKFSVNLNLTIHDLITEIFFGRKLFIDSNEGDVYFGKTDLAFIDKEQTAVKSSIDIKGKSIQSTEERIIENSETKSHDTSLGFRIEGHSSLIDGVKNVSKDIDVHGTKNAYVKASILKGAQLVGEATNVAFGDTLGGSADFYINTTDTQSNKNNFKSGSNILYADDISITATENNIDLEGTEFLSNTDDGFIKLHAKKSINFSASNDLSYFSLNRETKEFTLGAVANSNVMFGSAGAGVRAGYTTGDQNNVEHYSTFWPFNLSAKSVYFSSGHDVSLHGGKVIAGLVDYNIAGTLKIESVQDTSESENREGSYGGSVGIDVNTYTSFGLNGGINAQSGNSEYNSALTTEQSGVFARNIRGTIGGDICLKGAYLIGQVPDDTLDVHGIIYATTLKDNENKNGFIAGSGISVGVDGRPGVNVNYSSPNYINYKASQLSTIAGVNLKNDNKIIGDLNKNKNEVMKITTNDGIGNIEINGTFVINNKKENKFLSKNSSVTKLNSTQNKNYYEMTPHQIYSYAVSVPEGKTIANSSAPLKIDGKHYITVNKNNFQVHFDDINKTWRIISPLYGASKPQIPVEWDGSSWRVHGNVGLLGGVDEPSVSNLASRISSIFLKKQLNKSASLEMDDISDHTSSELYNNDKYKNSINYTTARTNGDLTDKTTFKEVNKEQFELLSIAYDINSNVREQLNLGAGNQKSDIIKSGGNSLLRTSVLQSMNANFFQRQTIHSQEYIRAIQAARAGNCSEHSEFAYHYANAMYGDKLIVRKMNNHDNSHSFIVIENKNNPDNKVIVDTWTYKNGFSLIEDNTLTLGRITKDNQKLGRQIYRFNKNTKSYENLSNFFEKYMEENFNSSSENLKSIVDSVEKNRYPDEIWDQHSFVKDENLVYKLRNTQSILMPNH